VGILPKHQPTTFHVTTTIQRDDAIARHRERWPPPPTMTIHGPQQPQHTPKRQEGRVGATSAGKRARMLFRVGDGEVATNGER